MLSQLSKRPGIIVIAVVVIGMLVWGFWPRPALVELVSEKLAPLPVTIV